MRLIIAILAAMVTYIVSLGVLTFVLTMMFSSVWWVVFQEWFWIWEYKSTPGLMILVLCVGIANFLIEDYIRCLCHDEQKNDRG